jgi:hypothetical protein
MLKKNNNFSFLVQCATPKITLQHFFRICAPTVWGVGGKHSGSHAPQIKTLQNTDCVNKIISNVLLDL